MTLTKPEIRALVEIYSGRDNIGSISEAMDISLGTVSAIIKKLEKKSLCIKIRKGKRIKVALAATSPAEEFRKLVTQRKQSNLQSFLYGLNFNILSSCLYELKTTEQIAYMLKTSLKSVQNNISLLTNKGLMTRKKRDLIFNRTAWPYLFSFLDAYRNFWLKGNLLWKFGREQVFEVRNKEQVEGVLTGFSAYKDYGVKVITVKHCCYLPAQRLSKGEIFLHSLLQIRDDTRLLNLAIVFFKKNKLNAKFLFKIATKYDLHSKLEDFVNILKSKDDKINIGSQPATTRKEIEEMLKLYKM